MQINKANRKKNELSSLMKQCSESVYEDGIPNTLLQQLSDIALYDAIYRCFNEGLRLDRNNEDRPKVIIDMFHEFFFTTQSIRIRRLFDQDKKVYSLRRLFDVVYANKELYTRSGYIYAHSKKIEEAKIRKMDDILIEEINKQYDLIANINAANRRDDDPLCFRYLEEMKKHLDKKDVLNRYTNTYIAHSSNKKNQESILNDLSKISLRKMQDKYKDIAWLSYTLSHYIGELILFEVPSMTYDQFEGWIGSLYKKNIIVSLNKYWGKRIMLYEKFKEKYWFADSLYINPNTIVKVEKSLF